MVTLIRHKMIGDTAVVVNTVLGNRFRAITAIYKVHANHRTTLLNEKMYTSEKLAIASFDEIGEEHVETV